MRRSADNSAASEARATSVPVDTSPSSVAPSPSASSTVQHIEKTSQENEMFRVIHVRRQCIIEDMCTAFVDGSDERQVRVVMEGETAVDEDGVFRDAITAFWLDVLNRFSEGEEQAVPGIGPSSTPDMWRAAGNVLWRGYCQVRCLPIRFCLACMAHAIFGTVPRQVLLDSTSGGYERSLMSRVLDGGYDASVFNDILEIMDRFHVTEQPSEANIITLTERCAEVFCIERPAYTLSVMTMERFQQRFHSVEELRAAVLCLRPDGRAVADLLRAQPMGPVQERAFRFLRQFLRNSDEATISRFLRFCTGSDVANTNVININFSPHMFGLERRLVAHTCSATLDLPTTYISYNEFSNELRNQLYSESWEMDFRLKTSSRCT